MIFEGGGSVLNKPNIIPVQRSGNITKDMDERI